MEEYPSNSILKEKRTERVISGGVSQRKAPILDRVVNGETTHAIWHYIIWDVLIPALKNTVSDMVTNGLDMALFGSDSSRSRRSKRLTRDRDKTFVSYSDYYDRDRRTSRRTQSEGSNLRIGNRHHFEEMIFDTRSDAEEVLSTLIELIDQYSIATVADFYDAAGLSSQYTDRNYGWDSLSQAFVRPIRGGFVIELPRPLLID